MDIGSDALAGPGGGWVLAHPSLHELAVALGVSPPDGHGLRAALVEWENVDIWGSDIAVQRPALVTEALIEADRTASEDLLGGLLDLLRSLDGAVAVLSALAIHDETLALRCIPHVVDPESSLVHVGALTTLRVAAAGLAHPDGPEPKWDLESLWAWPPQQLWPLILVADEGSPRPAQDLDGFYLRLFEAAPRPVFGHDPGSDHEAEPSVHAHVRAFIEQAMAVAAAGGDTTAWTRWIGQHQTGCGEPSCCGSSRFEAELGRRGFRIRVGRTPWT